MLVGERVVKLLVPARDGFPTSRAGRGGDRMQGSARATIARGSPSRARIRSAGRAWGALLAVIAFVTLLVALLWPRRIVCSVSPKARADIAQILLALEEYTVDHEGRYPDSLELLVTPDADGKRYLTCKAAPRDPWKNEYHYEPPSAGSSELLPHVWSYGKDGQPGGDDDIDSRTMNDE